MVRAGSQQPTQHPAPAYHVVSTMNSRHAVLHGIQPGNWHACRLSSRVSRVARMRADASRPRGTVFRTGPSSNSGDDRRQHAEPDSSPNSHPTLRVRSLLCAYPSLDLLLIGVGHTRKQRKPVEKSMGEVNEVGQYSRWQLCRKKIHALRIERAAGTSVVPLPAIPDLLTTSCSHESPSRRSIGPLARF
jgi:hypothetical protein